MTPIQHATEHAVPHRTAKELDIYAAEFAKLVDRYVPTRAQRPSDWLRRLPDEIYAYYQEGIASFGSAATTPTEVRGRLYLMHTTLLFLWMRCGKEAAHDRFQSETNLATQRTAAIITLERYRRVRIVADYDESNWCSEPMSQWQITLVTGAIDAHQIPDPLLKNVIQDESMLDCDVGTLARLQELGAVPTRDELSLA